MTAEQPMFCTDEMLIYLDELRESGETNMWGGGPYLDREFPELPEGYRGFHSSPMAMQILSYWMKTFGERHPKEAGRRKL